MRVKYNDSYLDVFGQAGWCPYEAFVAKLKVFAIDTEEYSRMCHEESDLLNRNQTQMVQEATMAQE